MAKTKYIMISKSELEVREREVFMSEKQVQELIEYGDTFELFLKKKIHEISAKLALRQLVWKEGNAYIAMDTIEELITSIEKTWEAYKEFKEKQQ